MILLDTNIVSEIQKPRPSDVVAAWLASIEIGSTYICGPVLMEQAFGAERHLIRTGSSRYIETLERLRAEYADRTLVPDAPTYELTGRLLAQRESRGRPISFGDAMIAAICLVNDAALATRNVRDFDGLGMKLVNPFEARA